MGTLRQSCDDHQMMPIIIGADICFHVCHNFLMLVVHEGTKLLIGSWNLTSFTSHLSCPLDIFWHICDLSCMDCSHPHIGQ